MANKKKVFNQDEWHSEYTLASSRFKQRLQRVSICLRICFRRFLWVLIYVVRGYFAKSDWLMIILVETHNVHWDVNPPQNIDVFHPQYHLIF